MKFSLLSSLSLLVSVHAFGGTKEETATSRSATDTMMMGTAGADAAAYGGGGFRGGGGFGAQCPAPYNWAGAGFYCLSGDLYRCYNPNESAQLEKSCPYGCTPSPPGVADSCDSYPTYPTPYPTYPTYPTPYPTRPPTPYPTQSSYSCARPNWYGGDACADFGAYKGKDLAWQACSNGVSSYGGGGFGTCEQWQQAACEDAYRNHVSRCCPYTSENYIQYCNPYYG